jgi:hypothetical protein
MINTTRRQKHAWLLTTLAEVREETIEKMLYHFETMVFDNSGEDKLKNIMEFRRQQGDYLRLALDQMKEEL